MKMNIWVQNMYNTSKIKIYLEKVHFGSLYGIINFNISIIS